MDGGSCIGGGQHNYPGDFTSSITTLGARGPWWCAQSGQPFIHLLGERMKRLSPILLALVMLPAAFMFSLAGSASANATIVCDNTAGTALTGLLDYVHGRTR